MLRVWLVLGVSAALGVLSRYYITLWVSSLVGSTFPYGTFLINVAGSFLLGFFLTFAAGRLDISPSVRLFVVTGFCGSFTTFSTFSYETVALAERGRASLAMVNAVGSVVAGLLAVSGGVLVAKALLQLEE